MEVEPQRCFPPLSTIILQAFLSIFSQFRQEPVLCPHQVAQQRQHAETDLMLSRGYDQTGGLSI